MLVEHGDALLRERMRVHVSAFARERLDALALRLEPAAHEAPELTPGYLFSPRAVSMLLENHDDAANPVAGLRAGGGRVRVQNVDGCLPCHGNLEALIESNRRMLERHTPCVDPASLEDSTVHGAVEVHPTARIRRSLLRGPVVIGPGATVTDAYIGPYTSIGAGVVIEASEIEHSIVLPEAQLRFVGSRLESSVIGRGARIVRGFEPPGRDARLPRRRRRSRPQVEVEPEPLRARARSNLGSCLLGGRAVRHEGAGAGDDALDDAHDGGAGVVPGRSLHARRGRLGSAPAARRAGARRARTAPSASSNGVACA